MSSNWLQAIRVTLVGFVALVLVGIASAAHAGSRMLVSSRDTNEILTYDSATGLFLGVFGSVNQPDGIAYGPDGNVYVTSNNDAYTVGSIVRFNGQTGAPMGTFVDLGPGTSPAGLTFGPNGNLFVSVWAVDPVSGASLGGSSVWEYNGATASFVGVFATPNDPTFLGCCLQNLAFGPDGNLYAATEGDVQEFDGATGAFIKGFGLYPSGPGGVAFGPDGKLYVSNGGSETDIVKLDPTSGALIGVFVPAGSGGLGYAPSIRFGPDGNLYAVDTPHNAVLRFDGATGAFIDAAVSSGEGGLTKALDLAFPPAIPVPTTKDACENGSWEHLVRANGTSFKNQGACVSFVNTGK